jgi:ATP-dependent DNA helicase RecG
VFGVTVYSNFEEKYDVSQGVSQGVPQGKTDVTQDVTNVTQGVTNDNPGNAVVDTSNSDDEQNGVTNDVSQGVSQDVPQGVSQGVPEEHLDTWIIEQIKKNSKITVKELAQISGFHERTIYRHVAKLPYIKYIGSGYSGHWEVEG